MPAYNQIKNGTAGSSSYGSSSSYGGSSYGGSSYGGGSYAMAAALMVMIRLPVSGKPLVDLADISSKVITPASLLHMTQFGIISAITVMKKLSMY